VAPQFEIGTQQCGEFDVGGAVALREAAPQGSAERLAHRGGRFVAPPETERWRRHICNSEKAMKSRGDAFGTARQILVPQNQDVLPREAIKKAGKVLGVEAPREIGMRSRVTQGRHQLPLAPLLERERALKRL